eukprot:gene789-biopygen140
MCIAAPHGLTLEPDHRCTATPVTHPVALVLQPLLAAQQEKHANSKYVAQPDINRQPDKRVARSLTILNIDGVWLWAGPVIVAGGVCAATNWPFDRHPMLNTLHFRKLRFREAPGRLPKLREPPRRLPELGRLQEAPGPLGASQEASEAETEPPRSLPGGSQEAPRRLPVILWRLGIGCTASAAVLCERPASPPLRAGLSDVPLPVRDRLEAKGLRHLCLLHRAWHVLLVREHHKHGILQLLLLQGRA